MEWCGLAVVAPAHGPGVSQCVMEPMGHAVQAGWPECLRGMWLSRMPAGL